LLREHGLAASEVSGTGRDGRITREDVLDHVSQSQQAPRAAKVEIAPIRAASHLVPHDRMRRSIAAHMSASLQTAPHVTAVFEIDLTAVTNHRRAHREAFAERGAKLTYTAYFVAATVAAMRAVPEVNACFGEEALEVFDDINIGVGTALADKGLIVPVIHGAGDLDLFGIASRLTEMTTRARVGKLKAEDLKNGTFTISNHGVSGSLVAVPIIINQPQVAILGIGKTEKRVVVVEEDGQDVMAIRPRAFVSLSIDHRALDAYHTNAWLSRFVEVIDNWD
jgi:2-oxoglutarate dehydrogenase E2 component (dihydrolipoamide succinyltransferase)